MVMRVTLDAAVQPAAVAPEVKAPSVPPIPPPPAIANISPFGDLLGKLRELAQVSPEAFKQVTGEIHEALQQVSQHKSSSVASTMAELSQRFESAWRTGSMEPLQASPAMKKASSDAAAPVATLLAHHVEAALKQASGQK